MNLYIDGFDNQHVHCWLCAVSLCACSPPQVFNQSTAVQEDATWRDNLYRMYTTSSANMRVAVYGSKHDAANYEDLLRRFCAVKELVGVEGGRKAQGAVLPKAQQQPRSQQPLEHHQHL